MFPRSRKKFVALIARCTVMMVVFAALMPATSALARTMSADYALADALGNSICTTHDAGSPVAPAPAAHEHCVFCTVGAPAVLAPRAHVLRVVLDAPVALLQVHPNDALPRDAVALHPLSPRAPPRAV